MSTWKLALSPCSTMRWVHHLKYWVFLPMVFKFRGNELIVYGRDKEMRPRYRRTRGSSGSSWVSLMMTLYSKAWCKHATPLPVNTSLGAGLSWHSPVTTRQNPTNLNNKGQSYNADSLEFWDVSHPNFNYEKKKKKSQRTLILSAS